MNELERSHRPGEHGGVGRAEEDGSGEWLVRRLEWGNKYQLSSFDLKNII